MSAPQTVQTPADMRGELEQFHPASFGWAMTCCDWNRTLAEEVLQTAYLKVLEGRARFDGRSSLRTWFFGVVRLTACEQRKSSSAQGLALMRWFRLGPDRAPVATPDRVCEENEIQRRVRELLLQLSARQRDVLHLVFYQDLTIQQSADVLGIGLGSARRHYERGKQRLRQLLPNDERLT